MNTLTMARFTAGREVSHLSHFLLSPHESIEAWQQKIVVLDPTLDTPVAALVPRANCKPGRAMAWAVRELAALDFDTCVAITSEHTFFCLRPFPAVYRPALHRRSLDVAELGVCMRIRSPHTGTP